MKSVAALGDDVWFFARETEGKTEGLEADRTLVVLVFGPAVSLNDWDRCHAILSVGVVLVVVAGRGGGGECRANGGWALGTVEGGANGRAKTGWFWGRTG